MGDQKNSKRKVDDLTGDVSSYLGSSLIFISKKRIRILKVILIVAFVAGLMIALTVAVRLNIQTSSYADSIVKEKSPLMKVLKNKGCVADGLLSGYGKDTDNSISLIERSECMYLHRSLETWTAPPNFELAASIKSRIKKKDLIYGMFIAEAINTKVSYYYPEEERNFKFEKMCRKKSGGFWGKNTCKAYFAKEEYRKYLRLITRKAIDMGIQSFLFGQIQFQDNAKKPLAPEIVLEMRKYAQSKGKAIVIGAQTNNITDSNYLRIFDFIEGGVGLNDDGKLEKGACSSRWWKKEGDRCWALVWREEYAEKANDVLVHFDWSGIEYDDMSTFARMDKETRSKILNDMNTFFSNKNAGFLMPFLAVIYEENGGCYGPSKEFYSPDNIYSCKDEDVMNAILKQNNID